MSRSGRNMSERVSCSQSGAGRREKSCTGFQVFWAGFRFLLGRREKIFTANRVEAQDLARARFADMLRHPFPDASDREIARSWAPRLGVSDKTIQNWLACSHSASIEDIFIVGAAHGVWTTMQILVGESTREEYLEQMGQK